MTVKDSRNLLNITFSINNVNESYILVRNHKQISYSHLLLFLMLKVSKVLAVLNHNINFNVDINKVISKDRLSISDTLFDIESNYHPSRSSYPLKNSNNLDLSVGTDANIPIFLDTLSKLSIINLSLYNSDSIYLNEVVGAMPSDIDLRDLHQLRKLLLNIDVEGNTDKTDYKSIISYMPLDLTFEDILMTAALETYLAIPFDLKEEVDMCLDTVNLILSYPLNSNELMSLKRIIMVYPRDMSKANESDIFINYGNLFYKTIINYLKLKSHFQSNKEYFKLFNAFKSECHRDSCYSVTRRNKFNPAFSIVLDKDMSTLVISELHLKDLNDAVFYSRISTVLRTFFDLRSIKKLTLQGCDSYLHIGYTSFAPLSLSISNFFDKLRNLQCLVIESCSDRLFSSSSDTLENFIYENRHLHSLVLRDVRFKDKRYVVNVINALRNKKMIKHLELSHYSYFLNNRNSDLSDLKAAFTQLNGRIEKLILSFSYLSSDLVRLIADCFSQNNQNQGSINPLNTNSITPISNSNAEDGRESIPLKYLILNGNKIKNLSDVTYLLKNIRSLELLDIESSSLVYDDRSISSLIDETESYPSDLKIVIGGVDEFDIKSLPFILKVRCKDQMLDLKDISISIDPKNVLNLQEYFNDYKSIRQVCLSKVRFSFTLLIQFLDALKYTHVEHLDISDNAILFHNMSESKLEMLYDKLKSLQTLKSLDLSKNFYFTSSNKNIEMIEKIISLIPNIKNFEYLNLKANSLPFNQEFNFKYYSNIFNVLRGVKRVLIDFNYDGSMQDREIRNILEQSPSNIIISIYKNKFSYG